MFHIAMHVVNRQVRGEGQAISGLKVDEYNQ